ncbi:MAG: hypothetical protein GY921_11280, partial [Phycisphaeraceae bacterium]|nr:hypothetical protein [Phycisphaeraceae bacterium]
MPSSVQTIESSGIASNRGETRFPGLRAAAVLAAIGSMTLAAAGQDAIYDGGSGVDDLFGNVDNWDSGFPVLFPDFGGDNIDIAGGTRIIVEDLIFGIGDLTNSSDG